MVIKTCKCVCMNTSFKAFSDENKDVILSQNKCFNHPTTTQLPGALPPGTPSELCLRPVRGRGGSQYPQNPQPVLACLRHGQRPSAFSLSHISILKNWQVWASVKWMTKAALTLGLRKFIFNCIHRLITGYDTILYHLLPLNVRWIYWPACHKFVLLR